MSNFVEQTLEWLKYLSVSIDIGFFIIIGSILEEIVAPIPSPFVMTTAAALAQTQSYAILKIFGLILIASIIKTITSYLMYVVADKLEDLVIGKLGKYIGVSHKSIEKIGSYLTGTWIDDFLFVLARALPFIPTSLVSIGAGVIKYRMRSYLLATFLGLIIRNAFYFWIGYFGWNQAEILWQQYKGNPVVLSVLAISLLFILYLILKLKDHLFKKVLAESKKTKK